MFHNNYHLISLSFPSQKGFNSISLISVPNRTQFNPIYHLIKFNHHLSSSTNLMLYIYIILILIFLHKFGQTSNCNDLEDVRMLVMGSHAACAADWLSTDGGIEITRQCGDITEQNAVHHMWLPNLCSQPNNAQKTCGAESVAWQPMVGNQTALALVYSILEFQVRGSSIQSNPILPDRTI